MSERPTPPSGEPISPRLAAAFDQLAEGVIVTDEDGAIVFINAAAAKLHGMQAFDVRPAEYAATYKLLTMDGTPYPSEDLPLARAALKGEIVEDTYWRIARNDGETIIALGTARPVLDGDGRQIGAVLTLRDETEREEERQALKTAVALKDMLLREIHHRVKNNLQLVSSLLNLQGRKTADPAAKDALSDLSSRVEVIADIHRALYEAGETDTIEVVAYLAGLSRNHFGPLAEGVGVTFEMDHSGACTLPIEKATSLALAINELILNSLQHAFGAGGAPSITLAIQTDIHQLVINYRDNGNGSLAHFDNSAAPVGFGRLLVTGLEKQLGAAISGADQDAGFHVSIKIPFEGNLVAAA
ncbi:MAG: histidine kinase dimerization/phosphoacceptor domain -containing protein [Pseudomonadota bacterium]